MFNQAIVIGRLGKDPVMTETANGKIARLSLATNETWRTKTGEKKERTEWHTVSIYRAQLADLVSQRLRKGDMVCVVGQLRTTKWTDRNGVDRETTEIAVGNYTGNVVFLSSSGTPGQSGRDDKPISEDLDDEIPF